MSDTKAFDEHYSARSDEELLHPLKRVVVILHGDCHRRLGLQLPPKTQWDGTQKDTDAAEDHEQQAARGKLVLAIQNVLQKRWHCIAF